MTQRWNESDAARIDYRRLWVERLFLRGLTMREIQYKLPEQGIVNPETSNGYALGTISRDVTAIKERWKQEASADIAEVKAAQLAELKEARRRAWAIGDISEIRHSLSLEADLTGTKAPKLVDVKSGGEKLVITWERNADDND